MGFEIGRLTRIPLGREGESNARPIEINVSDWLTDYPGSVVGLLLMRPGEDTFYPADAEVQEGVLHYTPSRADVELPGEGLAQIVLTNEDDVELRSRVVKTLVEASLPGSAAEAPEEPMQPFVDAVLAAADQAKQAAEEAAEHKLDGVSPTVEVSKADGVTTLTITDAEGVKTAEIKDGSSGVHVGSEAPEGAENVWIDTDGTTAALTYESKVVFVRPYTGTASSSNSVTATGYGASASARVGYGFKYTIGDASKYAFGAAVVSNDWSAFTAETPVVDLWLYPDRDMEVAIRTSNGGGGWGGSLNGLTLVSIDTQYVSLRGGMANRVRIDLTADVYAQVYADSANAQGISVFVIASGEGIAKPNATGEYSVTLYCTAAEYAQDYAAGAICCAQHAEMANALQGFDPGDYYTAAQVDELVGAGQYITAWGDSLTAQGGWTAVLAERTGLPVYNGGTGGETVRTICARQGADVMLVDGVTIPASGTVQLATYAEGFTTALGHVATPLLQGTDTNINPVDIGGIKGTLDWTGSSYNDTAGTWTFTRAEEGDEVVIDRPTPMTTAYDRDRNAPKLMILFMGQNGGYDDLDELVRMHRLAMAHSKAVKTLVLGLSSGTAADRAEYESRMRQEFGRYFVSLREYLSTYGLTDAGLTATDEDTAAMEEGSVPPQLLADSVHYTDACKTVIGEMIYKHCVALGAL